MYSTGSTDALGRVTGVQYPNSPQGVPGSSVDLQYDDFGRVIQISDETGATNLQYDVFSRITQIAGSGGRKTLTREYTPLPGAWRTRDTLSGISGSWDSYEDGKGRIYRSRNPFNQEVRREFDVAGALLKETLPNGTDTLTGYDAWGRLASIEHRGKTGTGTALGRIEKYLYAYDSHDRVTEETIQSAAGASWSRYAYDSFGRMVREWTGQGATTDFDTSYAYDRNDNRTQKKQNGVIEYSGFDAADRLLWTNTHSNTPPNGSGWSWRQFAYDDFGQIVYRARGGFIPNAGPWKREVDLKWDSQGRLREARDRSAGNRQLMSASYTADGERITKSDPITGAHINSYGLHDTGRNTVFTPGQERGNSASQPAFIQANGGARASPQSLRSGARVGRFWPAELDEPCFPPPGLVLGDLFHDRFDLIERHYVVSEIRFKPLPVCCQRRLDQFLSLLLRIRHGSPLPVRPRMAGRTQLPRTVVNRPPECETLGPQRIHATAGPRWVGMRLPPSAAQPPLAGANPSATGTGLVLAVP